MLRHKYKKHHPCKCLAALHRGMAGLTPAALRCRRLQAQDRLTAVVMARVVARNALVCASCLRSVVSGERAPPALP